MTREQILDTVREMFAQQPHGRTNDEDVLEYLDGAIGELIANAVDDYKANEGYTLRID